MREGSQKMFSTSSAVFLAALMVLSGLGVLMIGVPVLGEQQGIRVIIEKGDITVTGDESYSNEIWRVTGDIDVQSGGKLTLESMTIYMNCSSDGEYGIYVRSGGELIIKNSTITTTNTTALIEQPSGAVWNKTWGLHWKFYIYSGARATLLNSTFSYLWGDNGVTIDESAGGINILSSDVYMYNCTVEKSEENCLFIGTFSYTDNPINPKIYNSRFINSTAWGIMIAAGAEPEIVGNLISDAPYRGIQIFWYGDPVIKNNTIQNCGSTKDLVPSMQDPMQTAGLVIDYIMYSGRPAPVFENNIFINNSNGIGLRRFSSGTCQVILRNNTITRNRYYGIMTGPYSTSSYTVVDALIINNTISYNGWDGIYLGKYNNFVGAHTNAIAGNQIYGNGKNGILLGNETPGVSVIVADNNIYGNGKYGIEYIGGGGSAYNNTISNNALGEVHISGGGPALYNNTIEVSGSGAVGVHVEGSSPSIHNNMITGSSGTTLMQFSRVNNYAVRTNTLQGGDVGLQFLDCSKISFVNVSVANSNTGMRFVGSDHITVQGVGFTGVENALVFNNTVYSKIVGTSVSSSRDAITLLSDSQVILENSTFGSVGGYMTVLNTNSTLIVKNTTLPLARVAVRDTLSTVEVWWPVFVTVVDEGGYPMENVEVKFENAQGDVWIYYTPPDGKLSWIWMEEFYFMNGTSVVLNPYNISVSLEEYIPQWGDHTINRMLTLQYTMEFNYPPGNPRQLRPLQTHNVTPTLTWVAPEDPNGDVLHYTIEIYEDVVSPGTLFFTGETRDTSLFVERPMKYHHSYYVKITAWDPWGKSSEKTFKIDVVNTPPDRPRISVTPNPASTVEDLTINIVSPAEDPDTDPVDHITYIYTWYVNGVPVQEGEETTLSHHFTKEGDVVSVKVTPFDGIDYGSPATADVHIVNFAPYALVEDVNLTTQEDHPLIDVINLNDYFKDRDLDVLSFTSHEERHLSAEIDPITGNLTIYPEENWNGKDYLIISASDGRARTQPDPTIKVWVNVTSVNDPPVITSVNTVPLTGGKVELESIQNALIVMTPVATDPDIIYGDLLQFSTDADAVITSRGLSLDNPDLAYSFDSNTGEVSFKLLNALVGDLTLTITVTDSSGEEFTAQVIIHVRNLNDPPTFPTITSPSDGEELNTLTVHFNAQPSDDPDLHIVNSEESLTYRWEFGDGESQEIAEGDLNVTHTYDVPGTYRVTLTVTDSSGLSRSTTISIKVKGAIEKAKFTEEKEKKTFFEKYSWWIFLIVFIVLLVIGLVVLLKRREPLEEVAEREEKDLEQLKAEMEKAAPPSLPAPPEGAPEAAPEGEQPVEEQQVEEGAESQAPPTPQPPGEGAGVGGEEAPGEGETPTPQEAAPPEQGETPQPPESPPEGEAPPEATPQE